MNTYWQNQISQLETEEHSAFIVSAQETFSFAREWLREAEFLHIIERLSILRIRWQRINARISAEGLVHRIELLNGAVLLREPVTTRRYWMTAQREWTQLMERLLEPPAETD